LPAFEWDWDWIELGIQTWEKRFPNIINVKEMNILDPNGHHEMYVKVEEKSLHLHQLL